MISIGSWAAIIAAVMKPVCLSLLRLLKAEWGPGRSCQLDRGCMVLGGTVVDDQNQSQMQELPLGRAATDDDDDYVQLRRIVSHAHNLQHL